MAMHALDSLRAVEILEDELLAMGHSHEAHALAAARWHTHAAYTVREGGPCMVRLLAAIGTAAPAITLRAVMHRIVEKVARSLLQPAGASNPSSSTVAKGAGS
jgi:hypothetical protein